MLVQERPPRPEACPAARCQETAVERRLRQLVEELAIPRHAFANARNNAVVRERLAAALRGHGYEVRLQGRHRNVVALPGRVEGAVTLVAAHYDSVPDCPGADDDASGLAVMLECARTLAAADGPHPVGFVAFNAEEDGLAGSRDFVAAALDELGAPLRVVHMLEMVGFRAARAAGDPLPFPWAPASVRVPDFLGLVARGASNRQASAAAASPAAPGLHVVSARTWGPLHRWFPDLARSDHFPFWSAGLPALLWTDTGNFRNPHYHRPTDLPGTLDYGFMRQVTELLCAVVRDGKGRG